MESRILRACRDKGRRRFEPTFSYQHPLVQFLKAQEEPLYLGEIPADARIGANLPEDTGVIVPIHSEKKLDGFLFWAKNLTGIFTPATI